MTRRISILLLAPLAVFAACSDSSSTDNNGVYNPDGGGNNSHDGSVSGDDDDIDAEVDTDATWDVGSKDAGGPVIVDWPSAECKAKTADILSKMTRLQKAGQMVSGVNPQLSDVSTNQYGSVLAGGSDMPTAGNTPADWAAWTKGYMDTANNSPLKIPLVYAIDAVHGNSHPSGTVIFPHAIGLGASRDAVLVRQVAQMTALESIATGITLTYAPQASVAWDARWGRFYETFSEDVDWAAEMVAAAVVGLQGPQGLGTGTPGMIACAKHWAGDGQSTAGTSHTGAVVDRADIQISQDDMEKYGMAAYAPAIKAGLGCIMVSDTTWNGTWMTSDANLITTLLKGQYKFNGFVITDWNASVNAGGIEKTINAGVDMLMNPVPPPGAGSWAEAVQTIANSKNIPDSRIDDAVSRILNTKCQAGLFGFQEDPALLASVGTAPHRALGRLAVQQSLVVLQNNNNVLPLSKGKKVWIGGSGADDLAHQCGGWTITWQGTGNQTQGTTIKKAVGKVSTLVGNMSDADVEIVVLSEPPYAETPGDSKTLNTLPQADFDLLKQAKASGKPVVALIVSGRPPLITDNLGDADAWVAAWLPGTEGDGVADILFGDAHPTGKLSHSWRRDDSQANFMTCCKNGGYNPLFPLGFGLTY